jgi:putative ABC transport system permease protein
MISNYFKIVARNTRKHPLYVLINIFGLAVGMAVSILILLFVKHELSYDGYHENADRIVRVSRAWFNENGEISLHLGHAAPPFAPLIESDFGGDVVQAVRLMNFNPLILHDEEAFVEERFFFSDPEVFEVFSWDLLDGNAKDLGTFSDAIILTESMANKYFGNENPVGKSLELELVGRRVPFQVRGLMADTPGNSHFQVDFLASMSPVKDFFGGEEQMMQNFGSNQFSTYLLLSEGVDIQEFEAKLPQLIDRHLGEGQAGVPASKGTQLFLWPLRDIHLFSNLDSEIEPNGNIDYVYIYLAVALFILLIACINFMNLSTARSSLRSMEVGLRTVMGADRMGLVRQFMGESFVMASIALFFAVILVYLFLPVFSDFTEKELSFNLFQHPEYLIGLLGLALGVGLISGSYPALFLSGFTPSKVLKGIFKAGSGHKQFRSVLVTGQFAISVMLIVAVLVVINQLDFMQSKDLGFKKDDLVVLPTSAGLLENYQIYKDRLESHPGISAVTVSSRVPSGRLLDNQNTSAEVNGQLSQINIRIADVQVGHNFLPTYGIPIVAGRDFDFLQATDSTAAFILNETAVRAIGWPNPEDAVGKQFNYGERRGHIIGVMKDFHFESLHQPIVPIVFMIPEGRSNLVSIRIDADKKEENMAYLREEWEQLRPGYPFDPLLVNEGFNAQYEAEDRVKTIFTFFAGLAVLISILGLLGLATFETEQRTREIGIRKVMGAMTLNIVTLLGKDFMKLVLFGFLIAVPLSWYGMSQWLEDFAFHISISWQVFLLAGLGAGLIAAMTVAGQAIKAALANPIKSIKSE